MSDPKREPSATPSRLPAPSAPGNLLDAALAHLPVDQRQSLALKALEKRLDIDAKAVEAENRNFHSARDMEKTIQHVRDLENSTRSDYTVKADYNTASGTTNVTVTKSNNTVIIVIAIVVAIAVIMMFAK